MLTIKRNSHVLLTTVGSENLFKKKNRKKKTEKKKNRKKRKTEKKITDKYFEKNLGFQNSEGKFPGKNAKLSHSRMTIDTHIYLHLFA